VSQLQSVDARRVFPCFDEPDLKANFSVTITHNAGKIYWPALMSNCGGIVVTIVYE